MFVRVVALHPKLDDGDQYPRVIARQEIAMFNEFRRFIAWLNRSPAKTVSVQAGAFAVTSPSAFAFDPMWHGDHWQNLLSSPMDARRYVMEDWSVSTTDWREADGAAPAH